MDKFEIKLIKENLAYAGETASGNFSAGYCNIYTVEEECKKWKVELAHTYWENGEEEVAAKSINPESLSIIKNRLRLVVSNCEMKDYENSKYVTLRIAALKREGNNLWANLKNVSMGELSEVIEGNALNYFKKLGATTVDYKIDVFEQLGTGSKQLVVIYPKENKEIPLHAFIVTRIIAVVNEMGENK